MRISTNQFRLGGLNAMLDLQQLLSRAQQQVNTQKRVSTPSDDPVAFSLISNYNQEIANAERYNANISAAESRLGLVETSYAGVTNIFSSLSEVALIGSNGALDPDIRKTYANQAELRLGELLGLANIQFAGSEYLFSGSKTDTVPFARAANGSFTYNGDQIERRLEVASGVSMAIADTGFEVFQNLKNGNGDFFAAHAPTNSGDAYVSPGNVSDRTSYNTNPTDSFQITFSAVPGGGFTYDVVNTTTATTVVSAAPYTSGSAIEFAGRQVEIFNTPAAGDSFTIVPSQPQDLFTTVQNLANALRLPRTTATETAAATESLARSITELDRATQHIEGKRAEIGSRMNAIDNDKEVNDSLIISSKTSLSKLEGIDLAEAISQFKQLETGLQVSQQSYAQVQNLSLFNYL